MIIVSASVVAKKDNKVLLIKEKKDVAKGKYGLPGGKLETGETIIECAEREFNEETGGQVHDLQLIAITHKPHSRENNSVVRFVFYSESFELVSQNAELVTKWFSKADFLQMVEQERIRGADVVDIVQDVFSCKIEHLELPRLYKNK